MITDLGILEPDPHTRELTLVAVHEGVTVEQVREATGWELRVADNGIGIPEEYAERVFVIFQRLHGREEYEGTGIGLALAKKIVEFHGGRIRLDTDEPGPGATIRFTLPDATQEVP